jgi:CHAT domain-containing protein
VGSEQLSREVRHFRQLLEKRTTNEYRLPAERLYEWLVKPLESRLAEAKLRTLVVVPEGPLRSIPMAALRDPVTKQFLIEKYPLAVVPGLTLTDPRHIEVRQAQVLKAGLTQGVQGYPPLQHVGAEIDAVEELLGGTTLLDEAFRAPALESELEGAPFGVVHLASHGEFAGEAEQAFLLTFDEKLEMGELADLVGMTRFREQPLELLALSACQTAAGDERAALGLAGVAVKAGARSTLATLWYIDDAASAELVGDFYRRLAMPGTSRAEALQQAQLALLERRFYRHPAYWAPFLLIGSWL